MRTEKRIRRDTKVRFHHMDDFTGQPIERIGYTRGLPRDIRIRWPEEFAELPDDAHCYLIEPEIRNPHMNSPFFCCLGRRYY